MAKISTRLVADQRPEEAAAQLQEAVRAACPKGVTAEFKLIHTRRALAGESGQSVHPRRGRRHGARCSATKTVYIRSGGSIPIVGLVRSRTWAFPSVMMGFGLPDDNLHAPNEKFHLPNFYRGIEAVAHYLETLGR